MTDTNTDNPLLPYSHLPPTATEEI